MIPLRVRDRCQLLKMNWHEKIFDQLMIKTLFESDFNSNTPCSILSKFYRRNQDLYILLLWIQKFRVWSPLREIFWVLWVIVFFDNNKLFLIFKIIYLLIYSGQFIALAKKILWNNLPTNCVEIQNFSY